MNVNGHHSIICTACKKERSESQKARNTAGNSKNPSKEKSRITATPAAPEGQAGVGYGKCGTEDSLCLGLMDKSCTEWLLDVCKESARNRQVNKDLSPCCSQGDSQKEEGIPPAFCCEG